MPQEIRRSVSTELDAAGAGQVDVYPPGMDWVVTHTAVSVSSNASEPTARLYVSEVFREGTYSGSNDASNTRFLLQPGDVLTVVWEGGDPGARATMTVTGVQYPPGQAPPEV